MKKTLLSITFLLTIKLVALSQDLRISTDWLFVYYMPYDNNLSQYGEPIIKMISDSIKSENVIATLQADFDDTTGMTRYLITRDGLKKTSIKNEYSASSKSYEDYLNWVFSTISFKRLAIIFLDHGGKLDELCLDEKPINSFLKVDSLKLIFNKVLTKNKIDLLFLQVCSKGSIEPLYEFKDLAKYTLCSQIELGAPNYYYRGLFSELSNYPSKHNGLDVANSIVLNEGSDMYNSYTLVDNAKLDSLYILFESFTKKIMSKTDIKLVSTPLSTYYFGEDYWDLISVLDKINLECYQELNNQKKQLIDFISNKLIVFHKVNQNRKKMNNYCGLSISSYTNGKDYSNLQFYKLLKTIRDLQIKE